MVEWQRLVICLHLRFLLFVEKFDSDLIIGAIGFWRRSHLLSAHILSADQNFKTKICFGKLNWYWLKEEAWVTVVQFSGDHCHRCEIFVQIAKCICPNCKMYLSKLQNVFVKIAKCIGPTCKMYVSRALVSLPIMELASLFSTEEKYVMRQDFCWMVCSFN